MVRRAPIGSRADAKDSLRVSFRDFTYTAMPGDEITFGRGTRSTIVIDHRDLHLHRRTGSFRWEGGGWELHNDGDVATLAVDILGGFEAKISPGAHPLILPKGATGAVRILTPMTYLLAFTTPPATEPEAVRSTPDDEVEGLTMDPRSGLGLTDNEIQMLVAMCEPRLLDPRLPAFTIPATKDICSRLGINAKRAEDLVDAMVTKLAPYVEGLAGSNDGRAVNRRHRIVAFALETHLITRRDLRMLDSPLGDKQT